MPEIPTPEEEAEFLSHFNKVASVIGQFYLEGTAEYNETMDSIAAMLTRANKWGRAQQREICGCSEKSDLYG